MPEQLKERSAKPFFVGANPTWLSSEKLKKKPSYCIKTHFSGGYLIFRERMAGACTLV